LIPTHTGTLWLQVFVAAHLQVFSCRLWPFPCLIHTQIIESYKLVWGAVAPRH